MYKIFSRPWQFNQLFCSLSAVWGLIISRYSCEERGKLQPRVTTFLSHQTCNQSDWSRADGNTIINLIRVQK